MTLSTAISTLQRIELVPWFADVDLDVATRLAARSRLVLLQSGESIARRGQPQTTLSIVQSGRLEIFMQGRSGKRHVMRHLLPGEVFGLIPVLDGRPAVHDADAHGTTELLLLPSDAIRTELQLQPALALRLLQLMCSRSRQLYDLFAFSQLLTLDVRVAQLVMSLAGIEPQHATAAGQTVEVQMTQSDMSDMLGVSRQSLNTELKKLERAQLIKLAHARLSVVDPLGLERYVSESI